MFANINDHGKGDQKTNRLFDSIGVYKSIMAEILRPGTFSAIIAIDPTMFPSQVNLKGPHDGHPLAQLALKRRDHWKSRQGYVNNMA